MASPTKRKFRLQVSLRNLLILCTLVGVVSGWHIRGVNVQRNAVANLKRLGGQVSYSPKMDKDSYTREAAPWRPPWWIVERLGPDHFAYVQSVRLYATANPDGGYGRNYNLKRTKEVFAEVRKLRRLKSVSLNYGFTPEGSIEAGKQLSLLPNLKSVDAEGDGLTGLFTEFAGKDSLTSVYFDDCISNETLEELLLIPSLESLTVEWYSTKQREMIGKRRPDLKFWAHDDYPP